MACYDLIPFKKINDTHGHDGGDFILSHIAGILLHACRKLDMVCRWGGEEFLILLPETNLENSVTVAEKMRAAVAGAKLAFKERPIPVTISFGVSALTPSDKSIDAAIINQARK